MKSNFKLIVQIILASLSCVFIMQLFWLKGLYLSIEEETEKNVWECIDAANSLELEARVKYLSNISTKDRTTGEISFSQSIEADSIHNNRPQRVTTKRERIVSQEGETHENVTEAGVEEGEFSLEQMKNLIPLVKESMHQTLDTIIPVNIDTFYMALFHKFEEKGIRSAIHRVDMIRLDTDSVLQSVIPIISKRKTIHYTLPFDSQNQLGYRITITPLSRTVLTQMSGILFTTLTILIILAFAFWYLLHTIFRQKTLEEMKDDFTNNMTHELKTPIAVAYSATDALLNYKQGESKEQREKYLSICINQLERLSGLVEEILSSSTERRQGLTLKKEEVNVQSLAKNLIEQHQLKTNKQVTFHLSIVPIDLMLLADKTHIGNALSNLIDNAIKYSGKEVEIHIKALKKKEHVEISIADNGMGIPHDKQKYIFDKYYRVPQGNLHNAKGYGLGLYYVKTIIEKHGGHIHITSQPGKGTVFTLLIPISI